MKRLGLYSGMIYEEERVKSMKECGLSITDEQAEDKDYIQNKITESRSRCRNCMGCEMAYLLRD